MFWESTATKKANLQGDGLLTKSDLLVVSNSALGLGSDNVLAVQEYIILLLESFFVLKIKAQAGRETL